MQSLTHSSYSNEKAVQEPGPPPLDNERFEYLGDAVIGLVVAELLMARFPDACEGKLSRWRSLLVSRKTLAEVALDQDLGSFLLLGRGERRTGGAEKRSILAGCFEALVGALYLDAGMGKATQFLADVLHPWLEDIDDDSLVTMLDKKTHLQEKTQSVFRTTPVYRLKDVWGPEHAKVFRVEILIDERVVATGEGRSKKDAEQAAAHNALEEVEF